MPNLAKAFSARFDVLLECDVGLDENGAVRAALQIDDPFRFRAGGLIQIRNDHLASCPCDRPGITQTHIAGAAGDHRHLALQAALLQTGVGQVDGLDVQKGFLFLTAERDKGSHDLCTSCIVIFTYPLAVWLVYHISPGYASRFFVKSTIPVNVSLCSFCVSAPLR